MTYLTWLLTCILCLSFPTISISSENLVFSDNQKYLLLLDTVIQVIDNCQKLDRHVTLVTFRLKLEQNLFPGNSVIESLLARSSLPNVLIDELSPNFLRDPASPVEKYTGADNIIVSFVEQNIVHEFLEKFVAFVKTQDVLNGAVERDSDLFIFLSATQITSEMVLISEVKNLLKLKVALSPSISQVDVLTISQYENKRGQVIQVACVSKNDNLVGYQVFQDFTWNMFGYPLQVAVSRLYKPIYEVELSSAGKVISKRGFYAEFSETVYSRLNFTTDKFLCSGFGKYPPGAVTGTQLKNGTWVGCLGDIIYGRAEITVVAADVNRFTLAEFLPRFEYVSITFVTRQPRVVISWKAMYKAFHRLTWILTATIVITLTCLIWVGNRVINVTTSISSIGHFFFDLSKMLVSQNADNYKNIISRSGRLSFILWLHFSWILAVAYTSKLTALLTIPVAEDNVPQTFRGLDKASNFHVGAPKVFRLGIGGEMFKSSKSPILRHLFEKLEEDEDGYSCLLKTQNSNYGCISWNFLLEFDQAVEFPATRGTSSFHHQKELINFTPLTQVLQKRSIFRQSFSFFIENLYEMGITKKWAMKDKTFLRKQKRDELMKSGCSNDHDCTKMEHDKHTNIVTKNITSQNNDGEPKALKLENFQGSFGIIATGLVTSGSIFLTEIFRNKFPPFKK